MISTRKQLLMPAILSMLATAAYLPAGAQTIDQSNRGFTGGSPSSTERTSGGVLQGTETGGTSGGAGTSTDRMTSGMTDDDNVRRTTGASPSSTERTSGGVLEGTGTGGTSGGVGAGGSSTSGNHAHNKPDNAANGHGSAGKSEATDMTTRNGSTESSGTSPPEDKTNSTGESSSGSGATSEQGAGGQSATSVSAQVIPPLFIIAPTEVRADPTLAKGCWVRLFPKENYQGDNDLTIAGPTEIPALSRPTGEVYWKPKAESIIVGPKATVTVYENASFGNRSATLKPDTQEPRLRGSLKFTQSIDSLKIRCEK